MTQRISEAVWEGNLKEGKGTMRLRGGAFEGPYCFSSRFEEGPGTNPEELIGAAHAGCFSMALAHALAESGHPPLRVDTTAIVHLEKAEGGFHIPKIRLETTCDVPGMEESKFLEQAELAKKTCPVSKLLCGAEITLSAKLLA